MSTPIIIGGGNGLRSAVKKWGVWAGGIAATTGAAVLASPGLAESVAGATGLDPKSIGYTMALMGAQQLILAARRHLLRLPEPR